MINNCSVRILVDVETVFNNWAKDNDISCHILAICVCFVVFHSIIKTLFTFQWLYNYDIMVYNDNNNVERKL